MAKYSISDEAYLKAVLHSAKYVSAVSGLLLGSQDVDGVVRIEDALPLCHSATAQFTTPMAEMGLLLAHKLASSRGQELVGVYYGNEIADDRSIGTVPCRIGDKIRERFEKAILLMVESSRLSPERRKTSHCFRVCTRADTWGKGVMNDEVLNVSKKALRSCDFLLTDGCAAPYTIFDFEDHCLNAERDWLNRHVSELIDQEVLETSEVTS